MKVVGTIVLCFIAITTLWLACSKRNYADDPIVASIGNQVITASEFQRNFEFGMPFLKKGSDPKATYLNFMIKEKVLSQQGYRLGLENSAYVKENEKAIMQELLIEELFNQEIKPRIVVTPQEIREAITKSKVRWKFRYWFEPNLRDAENVYAAMKQQGYSEVVGQLLDSNREIELKPKDFESEYITWTDVDPVILAAIKDVPRGEISPPVLLNGIYVIFQITDIQRESFTENTYLESAESMRQTLFYRKALAEVKSYVDNLMTPKNVITKGDAFLLLADGLAEWKINEKSGENFLASVRSADADTPNLYALRNNLEKTLTYFQNGQWTIKDFLLRFDPRAVKTDPKNTPAFRNDLNKQLALHLRDSFLAEQARIKKMDKSRNLQQSLQRWRDKWVYDESRKYFLKGLQSDSAKAFEFFQHNKKKYQLNKDKEPLFADFKEEARRDLYLQAARARLDAKVDSLQSLFPVVINHAVLDTITVVKSKTSKWLSTQVFKSGSNRMAVPIADPAWGM